MGSRYLTSPEIQVTNAHFANSEHSRTYLEQSTSRFQMKSPPSSVSNRRVQLDSELAMDGLLLDLLTIG
ncbi:hypothetical protein DITRI_Ditri09bG0061500 [Diplodiscus trichospermus]